MYIYLYYYIHIIIICTRIHPYIERLFKVRKHRLDDLERRSGLDNFCTYILYLKYNK